MPPCQPEARSPSTPDPPWRCDLQSRPEHNSERGEGDAGDQAASQNFPTLRKLFALTVVTLPAPATLLANWNWRFPVVPAVATVPRTRTTVVSPAATSAVRVVPLAVTTASAVTAAAPSI